ncbi:MAG: M23 family metallopeptidase [Clostridiales bacterium]|jgi:murein DD-endopeptidase MepM/ murein hydrolase activator NlpD|nr:M23 family metallopeptidase [Clostridiales bacterium]
MIIKKIKLNKDAKQYAIRKRILFVITLCFVFTAVMGYLVSIKNRFNAIEVSNNSVKVTSITPIPTSKLQLVSATEPPSIPAIIIEEDAPFSEPLTFTLPSAGIVITEFSKDTLVYNRTMEDWRVHLGVDFNGDIGARVFAVANGFVEKIENDEMYGVSVEISHEEGYTSRYCNLQENVSVSVGDTVKKGDIIGGNSNTAAFEMSDPPHLHFELYKDGVIINPLEIIN